MIKKYEYNITLNACFFKKDCCQQVEQRLESEVDKNLENLVSEFGYDNPHSFQDKINIIIIKIRNNTHNNW